MTPFESDPGDEQTACPRPVKCASCGWRADDGGFVAGRQHLDDCPERGDAEVRGFVRAWQMWHETREVAWTKLGGWYTSKWAAFPGEAGV